MEKKSMYEIAAVVAGRRFPLMVTANEEPLVTAAVEQLNHRINQLQSRYSQLPKQDILTMLLLMYAKEATETQQGGSTVNLEPIVQRLDVLDELLENALDSPEDVF